jgi:hypothetical protein
VCDILHIPERDINNVLTQPSAIKLYPVWIYEYDPFYVRAATVNRVLFYGTCITNTADQSMNGTCTVLNETFSKIVSTAFQQPRVLSYIDIK